MHIGRHFACGDTMVKHVSIRKVGTLPRLPLKGWMDLTYRCDFNCRHCWVRIPPGSPKQEKELSLSEIRHVADEARNMGCREWAISGGEPMLRPDFPEIFDYLTRNSASYSINTNGSLITPEIARLLRRKGTKMVALYGATGDTHDRVTRTAGAFEATLRGFSYLREAGAGFIVQLVPMQANFHQWREMITLASSTGQPWRVGAPWLYLSCNRSARRNAEIISQRLPPEEVVTLDPPEPPSEERLNALPSNRSTSAAEEAPDDRLFARCIDDRQEFHIDPYGRMTFCGFIKAPHLCCDLKTNSFKHVWEKFIPSLKDKVRGGEDYNANCGSCAARADCRWCAAYAYLETGCFSAPVPYLCEVAASSQRYKKQWPAKHRRYFQIAGITVRLESDLDLRKVRFARELEMFAAEGPGEDNVALRHYFELPDLHQVDMGQEFYRNPPWAIRRKNGNWYYLGIPADPNDKQLFRVAVFNSDYTHASIYHTPQDENRVTEIGFQALSLFPTDQIWLAPLLADRNAVLLHSAAAVLNGQGFIFVGNSGAGKSTIIGHIKQSKTIPQPAFSAQILCDDRNILRRWDTGWRVHGTWSHGDVQDVSPASAPLTAVLFLQKASHNYLERMCDRKDILRRLLATIIKPMATAEWWRKELDVIEKILGEVPCYILYSDSSGNVVQELIKLTAIVEP